MENKKKLLMELQQKMSSIRAFENCLLELYSKGKIKGTVHTCIGQEACAVGVISALDQEVDVICSNHRGHGHYLAMYHNPEGLLKEIMGLKSGVCNGIGGSQHLFGKNFYSNGILGGMTPVSAGIALSMKIAKQGICVVFLGDGALGQGVIYESFNISKLWKLPILIVVECNGIAQSTKIEEEQVLPLESRPEAFGIKTTSINGNDVFDVFQTTSLILTEIRKSSDPQCLMLKTTRLSSHSKGDDTRSAEEMMELNKKDPLLVYENEIGKEIARQILEEEVSKIKELTDLI